MLLAIWTALQPYLLEIFKQKIDKEDRKSKWRRGTIGDFMALYDCLIELEDASRSIHHELEEIGLRNGAIARTIVASRIERLRAAANDFVKRARKVHTLLNIYNDDLAITLRGAREGKRKAWCELEVWLDALPSNLDEEKRLTPKIRFNNLLPTKHFAILLGEQTDHPTSSQAALEREAAAIKSRILHKLETEHSEVLDLRDKVALLAQLQSFSCIIDNISLARTQLAEFIRNAYPIDKMME